MPRGRARKNGKRQPQASNSASPSTVEINTTTPAPRTKPAMEPKSSQLPGSRACGPGRIQPRKSTRRYTHRPPRTLGHFAQQQQDRRPDANGGIAGDQADGKGARDMITMVAARTLPSVLVAQCAEEQAAQRANQERYGEGGQRCDHLHAGEASGRTPCPAHRRQSHRRQSRTIPWRCQVRQR